MVFVLLALLIISCIRDEIPKEQSVIVLDNTSCGGGAKPVFIIKLSKNDSIETSTLPKEFQVFNLPNFFKTKKSTLPFICTNDKVYPPAFDVFDVK